MLKRFTHWLHTQWPAGTTERMPLVENDGSTNVPGLYIVGDLTGVPLLKLSADSGARAVRTIREDRGFGRRNVEPGVLDIAIIGGGVSGLAAALEARSAGLAFEVFEASEPLSTIVNFPKGKPIYTYPTEMVPQGELQFTDRSAVKEGLLEELRDQTLCAGIATTKARIERVVRRGGAFDIEIPEQEPRRAHRVIVAIGRSGNFRKLGVPGEQLDKVMNRLHDPNDYSRQNVLVVGGGDSALETAIALATSGAFVTLSYRKPEVTRAKPENIAQVHALAGDAATGSLTLSLSSHVAEIRENEVDLVDENGDPVTIENDVVFSMIGRDPPLGFFRRSGVTIRGEWTWKTIAGFALFLLFCVFVYNWKAGASLSHRFEANGWFPYNLAGPEAKSNLFGTILVSAREPGFWYSLAYCALVVIFGFRRIRRRKTPYVKVQTLTLMAIQVVPLFLLPYVLLPWVGNNGWFDGGPGKWIADQLFPLADYGHGREYWRAFGLILAWPLFIWNVFASEPLWMWLVISVLQTFVLIPWIVRRWGKGGYCGWICSCGALAETLGDTHRAKMPHGPIWNRLNMVGQVILWVAMLMLVLRVVSWAFPSSGLGALYDGILSGWQPLGIQLNYYWIVDVLLAGIVGVGFYFWFSGRVWCRFACPLAALMHIYARFSRFRILSEKKKCISCNVCTSVCHQGIDVMSFANKGLGMEDPECVRCSACVESCPTGTLTFGAVDPATGEVTDTDRLAASPVHMSEGEDVDTRHMRLGDTVQWNRKD